MDGIGIAIRRPALESALPDAMLPNVEPPVSVLIHPTQFPLAVEADLHKSLQTREMNHSFHYTTPKQALRWLRLHEAFSPAQTDPDCLRIYDAAFARCAVELEGARTIEVVSLGCGGGQKDAQLLRRLSQDLPGVRLRYVPVDVSPSLVLTARRCAIDAGLAPENNAPIVIDLAACEDWAAGLDPALGDSARRVVCFFGMMPNFQPEAVLPQLSRLIRAQDRLLVSANLAPGVDYRAGVEGVLPLYDNVLTREWLWSVLLDLGLNREDGRMDFSVNCPEGGDGLRRIESNVTFARACQIPYGRAVYAFEAGETFRLFFSYRHTPQRLVGQLSPHGLSVAAHWINATGEEGVFDCLRGV